MICAEGFFRKFSRLLSPHLANAGIPSAVTHDPATQLSMLQYANILEIAAQQSADISLGLRLGKLREAADMGVVGHAMIHAPNLQKMISTFTRYLCLITDGVEINLHTDINTASLSYRLTNPVISGSRQLTEMAMSCYYHVISHALAQQWRLSAVHFSHAPPPDIEQHRLSFAAPVHFSQAQNALQFPLKFLQYPLRHNDPRLFEVLQQHLEQKLRDQQPNIETQVLRIIRSNLAQQPPSIAEVAAQLTLPPWTLRRRLAQSKRQFNQLIEQTRQQLSVEFLQHSELSVSAIAYELGYSEVSAFSRAFRRWNGVAPLHFREQQS